MRQVQNRRMGKDHPAVSSGIISRSHTMPKPECRLCSPCQHWHTHLRRGPSKSRLRHPATRLTGCYETLNNSISAEPHRSQPQTRPISLGFVHTLSRESTVDCSSC